ncbi:MAG: hypothetical protein VR70_17685 [Rhodospirillaceae bacterium BRH_c57]|nr:MAG: hypothetical protein VR70_17685 [Rhodospirillaceae bacterium BRH_c57]
MMRAPFAAALAAAAISLVSATAQADPVTLEHDGLTLNGALELADGKALSDGVVLMVHGTLAHNGMEIIAGQQQRLAERGVNTLAVSLSLGQDARKGMYDCTTPHIHRHEDAVEEIGAWVGWLKAQGSGPLTVFGHSRGGNQVAWFAAEHAQAKDVTGWVLVAPATWTEAKEKADYAKRYGADIGPFLSEARAKVAAGQGDALMDLPGFIYCEKAKASAAAVASYYAAEPRMDTPTLLPAMPKPVLLVIGAGDEVVPDLSERLAAGVPEGVTVETVAEAGHMFRDFAADDLADLVADFSKAPR